MQALGLDYERRPALAAGYLRGLAQDAAERGAWKPRRLEYYGGFNYIILFLIMSLVFLYCCRYQFCPRWLRFYRWMYAKRLTRVLDSFDEYENMFELSKRKQQVDPETGELYWVEDRIAQEATLTVGDGSKEETKDEPKPGGGEVDSQPTSAPGGAEGGAAAGGEEGSSPTPKRKKKARPLSPKKLALLQQQKEEAEAYAEACRKAIYVPLREERLRIVREEFEKNIESGNMGWQLSVEQKNAIGPAIVDGMQMRDPRSVKYFHDLTFRDKMERGRPKKHHRAKDPKDPSGKKKRHSPSPKSKDANAGSPAKIVKDPPIGLPTRRSNSPDRSPPRSPSPSAPLVRSNTAPASGLRQR